MRGVRAAEKQLVHCLPRSLVAEAPETLDKGAEKVADPDHPEHVLALDDRDVPDIPLAHHTGDVDEIVLGRRRHDTARHHVREPDVGQARSSSSQPKDVALREDPDESRAYGDDDRADALGEHARNRLLDRIVRRGRDQSRAHHVDEGHRLGV